MNEDQIDHVADLIRVATEHFEPNTPFRLRVLIQMLGIELDKARAEMLAALDGDGSSDD